MPLNSGPSSHIIFRGPSWWDAWITSTNNQSLDTRHHTHSKYFYINHSSTKCKQYIVNHIQYTSKIIRILYSNIRLHMPTNTSITTSTATSGLTSVGSRQLKIVSHVLSYGSWMWVSRSREEQLKPYRQMARSEFYIVLSYFIKFPSIKSIFMEMCP